VTTDKGINFERGQPKTFDQEFVSYFDKYVPLAGFVGYQIDGITALGYYRYMCDAPPPSPNGDTSGTGGDSSTVQPSGGGTKDGGTTPNDGGSSLDPQGGRDETERDETEQDVQSMIIEEDNREGLTIILIVLLCVLVPLLAVLGFVVYMFRKNKKNSVAAALNRERTSISIQREYNRRISLKEEKMEGKLPEHINIFAMDDEKPISAIPTDKKVMAMFVNVPTDDEVKELLKGKTASEKKALLKEIEKARQ